MKQYAMVVIASSGIFLGAMEEQNPFVKIDKQQERYKRADKCAEEIRDKIDEEMLGINKSGWFRPIVGTYYSNSRSSSAIVCNGVVDDIKIIESFMPSTDDRELVMNALMRKHKLFSCLMDKLVEDEARRLNSVNGCTINQVFDAIPGLSQPINDFVKTKALANYQWEKQGYTNNLAGMPFDKEEEIHFVPLFGHQADIDLEHDQLLMSNDSKYLRAADNFGNSVIWDMENGNQINCNQIYTHPSLKTWTRRDEDNHHCKRQRVLDMNGTYLATPGMALAFGSNGIHHIQNKMRKEYQFSVIMLFVRPTAESSLCQDAFVNSKGDVQALTTLQTSQLVNKLKGFPAVKLKLLIAQELENLKNQQSKL